MKRNYTVQIFTGGFDTKPVNIDVPAVLDKLTGIYKNAKLDCVMIGWNPGAQIDEIADFLKKLGIDVYLWLPVFSGLDGFAPLIGANGKPVVHSYKAEKGERFDFGCPVNPDNIKLIKSSFEANFGTGKYDGIFLDKIRFPSFISGKDPVFSCFCPYCLPYHKQTGKIDIIDDENPLGILSYSDLRYTLKDERLAELFAYKSAVVTKAIINLIEYFRSKGYKIGLDLFALYLSFFVGQDYHGLAPYTDFIKPMFYRKTNAPAGLPFELDMYAAAFGGNREMIEKRKKYLLDILNTEQVDAGFINSEINGINKVIGNCKHYAGIEINYNERIARITADYIHENITGLKNTDGFALSWDLCSTPDENLDAVLNAPVD